MGRNVLAVGDKIELRRISGLGKTEKEKVYISQLMEQDDEKKVKIAMPMEGGRIIPIEIGQRYELIFFTKSGLYQCRCKVAERFREGNLVLASVEILSEMEKYQRRQYYRLECLLDISYRKMSEYEVIVRRQLSDEKRLETKERMRLENWLAGLSIHWEPAVITDISGGGARIHSSQNHDKGDILMLMLTITLNKNLKNLMLRAQIVDSRRIQSRINAYEHRVEYIDIPKDTRELIVQYVFEEERKRRRKERGYD